MRAFQGNYKVSRWKDTASEKAFKESYKKTFLKFPSPKVTYDVDTAYGRVRVYYYADETTSERTPVILLHGRYTSSLMWLPNLSSLTEKFPVYMVDILGEAGMSHQTRPFFSRKDQAKWLDEVFRKLNLSSVILLGASMGGFSAVNYALHFEDRVKSLILLDPVFVFAPISLEVVSNFLLSRIKNRNMLPMLIGGRQFPRYDPMAKTVRLTMEKFIYRTPYPLYVNAENLRKLKTPILAVLAGKSLLHDSGEAARNGKKAVEHIELEIWEEADHDLTFSHAGRVNEKVLSFLRQTEEP